MIRCSVTSKEEEDVLGLRRALGCTRGVSILVKKISTNCPLYVVDCHTVLLGKEGSHSGDSAVVEGVMYILE